MKTLLVVLLFGLAAVTFATREKRFLFQCKRDSDCGVDGCCVLRFCASKRGLGQSCNFVGLHKCGCKQGLSCQVKHSVGSIKWYYSCQPKATPEPTPEPGSGGGAF